MDAARNRRPSGIEYQHRAFAAARGQASLRGSAPSLARRARRRAMSRRDDQDDWSEHSASLFRDARRAHDPTLAESARLAAVLTRIQSTKPDAQSGEHHASNSWSRAATSTGLWKVANGALGVVGIAAAAFAFIRFSH